MFERPSGIKHSTAFNKIPLAALLLTFLISPISVECRNLRKKSGKNINDVKIQDLEGISLFINTNSSFSGVTQPSSSNFEILNSESPTFSPSEKITTSLTVTPTSSSTAQPTDEPTTSSPKITPTSSTTSEPTNTPTLIPTAEPTDLPSSTPSFIPSTVEPTTSSPTSAPTSSSTSEPTFQPTFQPTNKPTLIPTATPTNLPSSTPSFIPSTVEPTTSSPTSIPTSSTTSEPTFEPTNTPTSAPTDQLTDLPSSTPTFASTSTPISPPTEQANEIEIPESMFTNNESTKAKPESSDSNSNFSKPFIEKLQPILINQTAYSPLSLLAYSEPKAGNSKNEKLNELIIDALHSEVDSSNSSTSKHDIKLINFDIASTYADALAVNETTINNNPFTLSSTAYTMSTNSSATDENIPSEVVNITQVQTSSPTAEAILNIITSTVDATKYNVEFFNESQLTASPTFIKTDEIDGNATKDNINFFNESVLTTAPATEENIPSEVMDITEVQTSSPTAEAILNIITSTVNATKYNVEFFNESQLTVSPTFIKTDVFNESVLTTAPATEENIPSEVMDITEVQTSSPTAKATLNIITSTVNAAKHTDEFFNESEHTASSTFTKTVEIDGNATKDMSNFFNESVLTTAPAGEEDNLSDVMDITEVQTSTPTEKAILNIITSTVNATKHNVEFFNGSEHTATPTFTKAVEIDVDATKDNEDSTINPSLVPSEATIINDTTIAPSNVIDTVENATLYGGVSVGVGEKQNIGYTEKVGDVLAPIANPSLDVESSSDVIAKRNTAVIAAVCSFLVVIALFAGFVYKKKRSQRDMSTAVVGRNTQISTIEALDSDMGVSNIIQVDEIIAPDTFPATECIDNDTYEVNKTDAPPDDSISAVSTFELIDIFVPPGRLGVVISTINNTPVIHQIKSSSVLFGKLQVGDALVAVDDADVRTYSASKISKLISTRRDNATRKLTILRTCNPEDDSN